MFPAAASIAMVVIDAVQGKFSAVSHRNFPPPGLAGRQGETAYAVLACVGSEENCGDAKSQPVEANASSSAAEETNPLPQFIRL